MNGADSGVLEGFATYNLSEFQTRFQRFQCAGDIMLSRSSMDSILRGLSEEFAALNPPINPRFRPPASEQQIVAAERALQVAFPESLRALLSCHDGQEFYRPEIGYGDPVFPMMHLQQVRRTHITGWVGSRISSIALRHSGKNTSGTAVSILKHLGPPDITSIF